MCRYILINTNGYQNYAQFLANLRRKVTLYHAKHPDDDLFKTNKQREHVSNEKRKDLEYKVLEDSVAINIYSNMFHTECTMIRTVG